LVIF
jgi:hypothetical protein